MRRILIVLTLAAAVAGLHACAADSPTAPKPGTGGGSTSSAVSIQLFTSNANPPAGTCTLIEALVNFNGNPVPDGTTVNFTTDFGAFGENGLGAVSITTTGGTAPVALCGPGAGTSHVKANATISGKSNSATININFQPSSSTLPFVSFCSPSFGPLAGGTPVTLNGGQFFGSPSTTRVVFTVNGVGKAGVVQAVSATQITVLTPGFPEVTAPSAQAPITLILGTNLPNPVTLSLPTCFVYGAAQNGTPNVTALLPSSGTNEGNTRVTVIGSGFDTTGGVEVFFGAVQATVVSVSYNQVVVLSPPAFGAGAANLNQAVAVTVKNIASGIVSNATVNFQYTPKVQITAWNNNFQPLGGPFVPMTIYGQGFQAPVAVDLAGWAALVQSVTATEIVVIPGPAVPSSCANITGNIQVTNIDTGDSTSNGSFTYIVPKPAITGVVPGNSCPDGGTCSTDNNGTGGLPVVISGTNFAVNPATGQPDTTSVQVKFGAQTAFLGGNNTSTTLNVTSPITATAQPTCGTGVAAGTRTVVATVDVTVTNLTSTCSVTAAQAFQYIMPCVAPAP